MKNLLVRAWYLLLGGVLTFLSLEYLRLRDERTEIMKLAHDSVSAAHDSLLVTNDCLNSYAKLKKSLGPALLELSPSTTTTASK